jgi:transposase
MYSITDLLDLEDSNVFVSEILIDGNVKTLVLETPIATHFCPSCGFRMHSRGIKARTVSHPILQDGCRLVLRLKQRRWRCTNPDCLYECNEEFRLVNKSRRITNATDMMIVLAFRDLSETAASIARKFKTSDTHVLDVFDRYVKLERLELTEIISVDEVHTEIEPDCKYSLVIQDFFTGDPIDVLRSRKVRVTEPYFASIPIEERKKVRYLLSDMYNPYLDFVDRYFPNAVSVVDSFHVVQWIVRSIDAYVRALEKRFRQRDRELQDARSAELGRPVTLPTSDELYLLKKYRWLILANRDNVTYHSGARMDPHFRCLMNTYDYEDALFRIDPRLQRLRDLKELYVSFNARNAGQPLKAREEIEDLIDLYFQCGDGIFVSFAQLLCKYKEPIINSFIMVQKHGPGGIYDGRLSNGPIESLNRKVKDLKRLGRGFRSFEHFRNRFLYATRNNPVLYASSDRSQVQYFDDEEDE